MVLTGTQNIPFGRLAKGISDGWADLKSHEPLVIQAGNNSFKDAPSWARIFDFCSSDEIASTLRNTDICITHGGTGSIIGALTAGCKVVVMPRLKRFGEHNDDHQLEIAELFAEAGLVVHWRESMTIRDVLGILSSFKPVEYRSEFAGLRNSVALDIRGFLGSRLNSYK